MLTHGREPGIFCHLSLIGLWPGDPNFTVSSLARCLRDLEQVPDNGDIDHTDDLSRTTSNQSLFTCLLDQTAFKATLGREGAVDSTYFELHGSGSEPTAATDTLPTTFTKLPRAFLLQMDNSAKDNKNIHVLAFCSELVKRSIFETVEINFLMVGHTHEDIDALFSKYEDGLRVEQDEPALDELEKELQAENEMQLQPYVGLPSLRPKRAFVPLEDICEGKFIVLRPEDDFEAEVPRAVWLGRVMGEVVRDNNDEHHGQFQIEWWRPQHRKSTNATNKERYSSLLVGQKDWEKDPGYNTPHWINASAAIYSWKYRAKEGVPLITKLNPLAKAAIKSHFEKLDANEGRD
ncbi:hypothetical protein R1sor_017681 [Riccia sorocarpa]|uniref:DUF7869 domain-containing protein n=1 Tax=Riccia sorocarpa TaxID=122646 RepID=A0ABD3IAV0_9MARC